MIEKTENGPQRAYKYRYEGAKLPVFCAYCEYSHGKQKPLNRRGHVISGFIYKSIRDALKARNRAITSFKTYDDEKRGMPSQDGIKFKHLCDDCENRFGRFETKFRNLLDKEFHEDDIKDLDGEHLPFCLSIAWRVIYSNSIRSGKNSDEFRQKYNSWLTGISKQLENINSAGEYDTYFFSGKSILQERSALIPDDSSKLRWHENEYMFSVRQSFEAPELYLGFNGVGLQCEGDPVVYVQLGVYHFLFTPVGYFDGSIVESFKIRDNFYSIPCVRDMKALGDIYGRIREDVWCRAAYLERHS